MKRFLLIVSIILLSTVHSKAQTGAFSEGNQSAILRFYPNPATSVITFDFQKNYDKGYTLLLYNFLGRKMLEQTNLPERTTIDLANFTRGVYVYQLRDRTGALVESGKFQVSK